MLALTDGQGVDVVIETGGGGTLPQSMQTVRPGGTISLVGVLTGFDAEINPIPISAQGLNLHGMRVGSHLMFEEMNAVISTNKLQPIIDRVFSLDQAPQAYPYLKEQSHFGKVVIAV